MPLTNDKQIVAHTANDSPIKLHVKAYIDPAFVMRYRVGLPVYNIFRMKHEKPAKWTKWVDNEWP